MGFENLEESEAESIERQIWKGWPYLNCQEGGKGREIASGIPRYGGNRDLESYERFHRGGAKGWAKQGALMGGLKKKEQGTGSTTHQATE